MSNLGKRLKEAEKERKRLWMKCQHGTLRGCCNVMCNKKGSFVKRLQCNPRECTLYEGEN